MQAILNAVKKQDIPINQVVVISSKPSARGLRIAKRYGVETEIVESKGFQGSRWEYDQKIIDVLNRYRISPKNSLICLAGFLRILSPEFIKRYKNRILNIHPAILPSFPGLNAQKRAVDSGARYSGCTVHFVDEEVDAGPILVQKVVKVRSDDTEETLAKRILAKEHKAYPEAVRLIAEKKISVIGRKVKILS